MIDRRSGLGGSEIAAVAGLNPYSSPLLVWAEKTGRVPPKVANVPMRLGNWLEPFIAQEYADRTGYSLKKGVMRRHASIPWMFGTPDYYVIDQEKGLECKYTGRLDRALWGPEGTDQVPPWYLAQCQHYMVVCGLPCWDLAVISSSGLRVYQMVFDAELADLLLEAGERFWIEYVLADRQPPLDPPHLAQEYLAARYREQASDVFVKATGEAEFWSDALRNVRRERKALESDELEVINNLKALIGESAGIEGSGFLHTWKQAKASTAVDWQAVALALKPTPALIRQHTKVKPGSRRFVPKWTDDGEGEE